MVFRRLRKRGRDRARSSERRRLGKAFQKDGPTTIFSISCIVCQRFQWSMLPKYLLLLLLLLGVTSLAVIGMQSLSHLLKTFSACSGVSELMLYQFYIAPLAVLTS